MLPINPKNPLRFEIEVLSISLALFGKPAIILYFFVNFDYTCKSFNGKLAVPQLISIDLLPSTIVTKN